MNPARINVFIILINTLEWWVLLQVFSHIHENFFQAVAGLLADARQLLTVARDEAKQYKYDYGVSIPVKVRCKEHNDLS